MKARAAEARESRRRCIATGRDSTFVRSSRKRGPATAVKEAAAVGVLAQSLCDPAACERDALANHEVALVAREEHGKHRVFARGGEALNRHLAT